MILKSKLSAPEINPDTIIRRSLMQRLSTRSDATLALICAPSGYGKSCLARQYLAEHQQPFLWFTADERDNSATRFWDYIVAGFQSIDPAIVASHDEYQHHPMSNEPSWLIDLLLNDLQAYGAQRQEKITLVIDDFHTINNKTLLTQFSVFVDYLPRWVDLILLTRTSPDIDLEKRKIRGQVMELTLKDLSFDHNTCQQLFNQQTQLGLSDNLISTLLERSGGWPAALAHCALELQACDDKADYVQHFHGPDNKLTDYLLAGVLSPLESEQQRFLLQLSFLPEIGSDLCKRLSGHDECEDWLRQLKHDSVFLTPVDKHARWHQIQPFFKRLLQRHYKSLHRHDNVANRNYPSDMLIAAVHCYLEHNKTALALELLVKLQDWPWLSSVLATVGPQRINDGDKKQLYQCLIQIPQKLLSADPNLLMLLAKSYPDSMMRKEAPLVYSQAQHLLSKQLLAANNDKDIALETLQNLSKQYLDCILNQSLLLRSYEQYELALTLLENPEVETLLSGQAVLSTHLNKEIGVLYFMQGKMQQADTLLLASINTAKTLRIEEVLVFSSGYILMSHIEQGRLDEASNYISDLLIWLEDNNWNSLPIIQWLAVPHIVLLIEQNKLEQASELIHNIQHNFKHSIITQAVQFRMLHFIEAKLHLAREEFNQARQALKQMERFVPLAGNHNFGLRSSGALSVLLHIKTRQTTEVKKWLKENETSLLAGDDYSKEADRLTLARCYSYLGQFQDCATVIKEVRQRTSRKNQLKTLVKSYIIEALNFLAQKKQGHALKTMEKAVQLSLNTGFCGLFYEEGQTALELLQQLHASDIQTDAVSTLLTAMGTNKVMPPQASSPDLPEILSVRERQILQLMSKGDSNKDLADKLGIKEGTVKVHTSSIYRKLKVKNRSQAIAKIRG